MLNPVKVAVASLQILNTYNGCPIPGTDQIFRLNWAAFGVGKGSTEGAAPQQQRSMPCVL